MSWGPRCEMSVSYRRDLIEYRAACIDLQYTEYSERH